MLQLGIAGKSGVVGYPYNHALNRLLLATTTDTVVGTMQYLRILD